MCTDQPNDLFRKRLFHLQAEIDTEDARDLVFMDWKGERGKGLCAIVWLCLNSWSLFMKGCTGNILLLFGFVLSRAKFCCSSLSLGKFGLQVMELIMQYRKVMKDMEAMWTLRQQ